MLVRFVCKTHSVGLQNCGNGRILFPTACLDPIVDADGWMELDSSEFYCPARAKLEDEGVPDEQIGECEYDVETTEGYRISDSTELTDKGWSFSGKTSDE